MSTVAVRWERGARAPEGVTRRSITATVRRAVRAVLEDASAEDAEVSVALVGDVAIAALNEEYLGHEGPTDVLSFPLFEEGEAPVGDVYVGVEQAVRQAAAHHVDATEEIARLAIHGTLHVIGWDHPDGAARTESPMWQAQERLLREVLPT